MSDYAIFGRVITGRLNEVIEDGVVLVEGGTIKWVGKKEGLEENIRLQQYERVEIEGTTVMPGLIDAHVHISFGESRTETENAIFTPVEFRTLKAIWNARKVLQAGVTSAFDAGTTYMIAPSIRDAIDSGMFPGPRFSVSGPHLTSRQGLEDAFPTNLPFPPGQAAWLTRKNDDLVEFVRMQAKAGVDHIKVSGSNDNMISPDSLESTAYTFEEFKIISDEAHRLGLTAAVHSRGRESTVAAAKAGFDVIMHASYIDQRGIELCLENGIVLNPTLTLLVNTLEAEKKMPIELSRSLDPVKRELDAAVENLQRAYDAGIPFVAGSESGWSSVPYGHWHAKEMSLYVEYFGMSPLEAIYTGTGGAAHILPKLKDKVGILEEGRFADILLVRGEPDKNIGLLADRRNFERIWKNGELVDREEPAKRERMWYEKEIVILNGLYEYDPDKGEGVIRK